MQRIKTFQCSLGDFTDVNLLRHNPSQGDKEQTNGTAICRSLHNIVQLYQTSFPRSVYSTDYWSFLLQFKVQMNGTSFSRSWQKWFKQGLIKYKVTTQCKVKENINKPVRIIHNELSDTLAKKAEMVHMTGTCFSASVKVLMNRTSCSRLW